MRTALSGSETEDGVTALRSLTEADRHFYAAFERLEFAPGQFKHADHVRLAWIFLRVSGSDLAGVFSIVFSSPRRLGEVLFGASPFCRIDRPTGSLPSDDHLGLSFPDQRKA